MDIEYINKEQKKFVEWMKANNVYYGEEMTNVWEGMFDVWEAGQKELQELSDRECPACHYPNDEGRGDASD